LETCPLGRGCPSCLSRCGRRNHKSTDTRGIICREAAEDGVERGLPEHAAPGSDGGDFQLQGEQVGAQHAGREPWRRAKDRVAVPHDGVGLGKVKVPELHDIVPGACPPGLQGNIKNCLQSKNILHNQGREAPHLLTGLSSFFEKSGRFFE